MVASRQVDMNNCVLTITLSNIDSVGCAIASAYPTDQGIRNLGRKLCITSSLGRRMVGFGWDCGQYLSSSTTRDSNEHQSSRIF